MARKSLREVVSHVSEWRLAGFRVLWFFLTLSIESSFIPIGDVMFEHRLYLPSFGIFLAFAVLAARLATRVSARGTAIGAVVVLFILGVATFSRNQVWRDPVSMWKDVVEKSPGNERGFCNLGVALLEQGETDEAIKALLVARKLNPDYAKTYLNLGTAFGLKGMPDQAIQNFQLAVLKDKKPWLAHVNLGIVYWRKGFLDKGIEHLEKGVKLNPRDIEARSTLEKFYRFRGYPEKAEALNRH